MQKSEVYSNSKLYILFFLTLHTITLNKWNATRLEQSTEDTILTQNDN